MATRRISLVEFIEFVVVPVAYGAVITVPETRVPLWTWPIAAGLFMLALAGGLSLAQRRLRPDLLIGIFFLVLGLLILVDRRLVWFMIPLVPALALAAMAYLALKGRA